MVPKASFLIFQLEMKMDLLMENQTMKTLLEYLTLALKRLLQLELSKLLETKEVPNQRKRKSLLEVCSLKISLPEVRKLCSLVMRKTMLRQS